MAGPAEEPASFAEEFLCPCKVLLRRQAGKLAAVWLCVIAEKCQRKENRKRFPFPLTPLPHDAGKAQEVPSHQEQCGKKKGTIFPGEPGRIPSKDGNTGQEQGSIVPLRGDEAGLPPFISFFFVC